MGTIAPEIYGHFVEHIGGVIYNGLWVGKDSPISNIQGFRKDDEKLKAINPTVIRWPGGCFAEGYDWRDGIGENRPIRPGWWTKYDGRYETNEVGTHEFMDFCELVGAKAYFAANVNAVNPLYIRNWMDYCTSPKGSTTLAIEREENGHPEPFDIPYWGVGNESWGGGGNMRPEVYGDAYRSYAIVMDNVYTDAELIAGGPNADDYAWTQGVIPVLLTSERHVNGYSLHYYCSATGDAVNFTDEEWNIMMEKADKMETLIKRNWNIICSHGMEDYCKLVVDEWGCWHPEGSGPSKGYNLYEQQSTMRDAMVTAHTLNIFNRHCDKVKMANAAQLSNCLHSLFLSEAEKCIVTPTYHVFDMYKEHQGADAIEAVVTDNDEFLSSLSVSASYKDGKTLVTIGNISMKEDVEICLDSTCMNLPEKGIARVLANEDIHAHNTFENPDTVKPVAFEFDPRKPFVVPKAGIVALQF